MVESGVWVVIGESSISFAFISFPVLERMYSEVTYVTTFLVQPFWLNFGGVGGIWRRWMFVVSFLS